MEELICSKCRKPIAQDDFEASVGPTQRWHSYHDMPEMPSNRRSKLKQESFCRGTGR